MHVTVRNFRKAIWLSRPEMIYFSRLRRVIPRTRYGEGLDKRAFRRRTGIFPSATFSRRFTEGKTSKFTTHWGLLSWLFFAERNFEARSPSSYISATSFYTLPRSATALATFAYHYRCLWLYTVANFATSAANNGIFDDMKMILAGWLKLILPRKMHAYGLATCGHHRSLIKAGHARRKPLTDVVKESIDTVSRVSISRFAKWQYIIRWRARATDDYINIAECADRSSIYCQPSAYRVKTCRYRRFDVRWVMVPQAYFAVDSA